jgi:hypothetical protein
MHLLSQPRQAQADRQAPAPEFFAERGGLVHHLNFRHPSLVSPKAVISTMMYQHGRAAKGSAAVSRFLFGGEGTRSGDPTNEVLSTSDG